MMRVNDLSSSKYVSPSEFRLVTRQDILTDCVETYGFNTTSYVLLEGQKSYFISKQINGFIAYQTKAGVVVIGGDPVCKPSDAATLLREFMTVMRGKPVCAYQVSPEFLKFFRANDFDDVQIGSEAVFDLHRFTLAGGDMELVRAATNKARREGVVVTEFNPFAPDPNLTVQEMLEVSKEWLADKGSREMGFLLGGLGLNEKTAKRYFIARSGNGAGRIEGFIVCEPVYARKGYYLDVTRRRVDAVRGTMELLTTEIFRQLKSEGYMMASMGLAPLANLVDPDLQRHPRIKKLMQFAFERVEDTYDFKCLYRYKSKYHPHRWEHRYLCFNRRMNPRMLYALLQVKDAFSFKEIFQRKRTGAVSPFSFRRKAESWKKTASFTAGLCSAFLLWH